MIFYLFISFVITQRIFELIIAKGNGIYIKSIGGFEVGDKHYPVIVAMHFLFLLSFFSEGVTSDIPSWWPIPLSLFLLAQGLRIWSIISLGKLWNTRIYIIPNLKPIKKGPYQYLRHPNYLTVITEILTIPLIFGAYYTAISFSLLNALVLTLRISIEEEALIANTEYGAEMNSTPRLLFVKSKEK